jgi:hypothetical protein
MIILLKENANQKQVENLTKFLKGRGFELHMSEGTQHTIIGLIGDTSKVDIDAGAHCFFATFLEVLADAQVVVEYTYAFLAPDGHAYMIFRVDDNAVASAALAGAGIKTANQEDLF